MSIFPLKLIIIQIIIIFSLFSQSNSSNKIDSILEESFQQLTQLQFIESLKQSDKALHLSLEADDEKGVIYSYLHIARALQEVGLRKEALKYVDKIEKNVFFKKDAFVQSQTHYLRGRIASSQRLYSLEKEHYLKQLKASENIADPKRKELSITMAYFYIQHLYGKQNNADSVELYQELLREHFRDNNNDSIGSSYYISLYVDKGLLYKNLRRYDEAAEQLDKSLQFIQNDNTSLLLFISIQKYTSISFQKYTN